MKKRSIKSGIFLLLSIIFSLFISCEVGLGSSVDTEDPVIEISNPPSDSIIRDEFAVRGTWHDDGSIESLTVTLKNIDTSVVYGPFSSDITGNDEVIGHDFNGEWSCTINPKDPEHLIPDGNYEATVTIQDGGDHVVKLNRTYAIDNTPPVVILERPGSKVSDESSIDTYGRKFTLEGMASDDHNVDHIEVLIYKEKTFETLLDTVNLNNVPPTISLEVASFEENVDNAYSRIYGSQQILSDPAVTRYCKIIAYDGAVKYPLDGSEPADADKNGNATEIYYLKDEVSSAGILTDNCKITDIYNILNGTQTAADDAFLTKLQAYANKQGAFVINPKNNPTYTASVRKPLNKDGKDFAEENSSTYTIYEGFPITIEVTAGLDNYSMKISELRPYAVECDSLGNPLAAAKKVYLEDVIQTQDSVTSYKWNTTITYKKGLENGKCYVIGVDGTDEIKNPIIPKDSTGYGFKFDTKAEVNVEIEEIKINNGKNLKDDKIVYIPSKNPGNTAAYSTILVKGAVYAVSGVPKATIYMENEELAVINFTSADEDPAWDPGKNNGKYKYLFTKTISAEKLAKKDTNGEYNIKVKAVNGSADNTYQKVALYDAEKPVIGTFDLSPTASKFDPNVETGPVATGFINGKVDLNLDVRDDWSQLDTVNVTLQKKTGTGAWENLVEYNPTTNFRSITYSIDTKTSINSKTLADNDKLKVIVTAVDKAGNKTISEKEYTVDQSTDIPVVLPAKCENTTLLLTTSDAIKSNETNPARKNYIELGNMLSLVAYDDDGIDTIKVQFISEKHPKEETKNGQKATEYPFDVSLPGYAGIYPVKLTIKDIYDTEKEYNFVVRVVTANPLIEKVETAKYTTTNTLQEVLNVTVVINSDQPDFTLERKVISKTTGNEIQAYNKTYTKDDNSELSKESPEITDAIVMNSPLDNGVYTINYTVTDSVEHKGTGSVDFNIDNAAPVIGSIVVPTPDESEDGSFVFNGTVSDGTETWQSGVQKVEYQVVIDGNTLADNGWKTAGGTSEWRTTIDFSGETEGKRWFYVQAYDKAGTKTANPSVKEFWYDKSKPSASIESYTYAAIALNNGEFYYGREFTLNGKASDTNGISEVKLIQIKNPESDNIKTEITIPVSSFADSKGGNWTVGKLPRKHDDSCSGGDSGEFDGTNDVAADGTYKYYLWIKDVSGKEMESLSQTLFVDRTAPGVTINEIKGSDNTLNVIKGSRYKFTAVPKDEEDGSGVVSVSFEIFKITDTETSMGAIETVDARDNDNAEITKLLGTGSDAENIDLPEGKYKLVVTAKDNATNVSAPVSAVFYVDQSAPVVEADNVDPVGLSKKVPGQDKVQFTMTGTVTDTNAVASVKVYRNDKAETDTVYDSDTVQNWDKENWSFTEQFTIATEDGDYIYTIKAKDIAGRETVITRTVTIDTQVPVVDGTKLVLPTPAQTQNAAFNFEGKEGSVKDKATRTIGENTIETSSGLSKIDFIFADSKPADTGYTSSFSAVPTENGKWNNMQTFEGYTYFYDPSVQVNGEKKKYNEGVKKLWVKAFDKAGNSSDWTSAAFTYDVYLPEISETGVNTDGLYKKATYNLSGSAIDSYGVSEVKVTPVKKIYLSAKPADWPGEYYSDELCKNQPSAETFEARDYYKKEGSVLPADLSGSTTNKTWTKTITLASESAGDLSDGKYSFIIEVKDISGKSSSTIRRVNIDTSKPSVGTVTTTNSADQKVEITTGNYVYNTKVIKFKAEASDTLSGVTGVSYCYSNKPTDAVPNPAKTTWEELTKQSDGSYSGSLTFAQDGDYSVYFKATDMAGNEGEKATSFPVNIDSTAPVNIKLYDASGTELTGIHLTNGSAPVTYYIEASDGTGVGVKGFAVAQNSTTFVEKSTSDPVDAGNTNAGRYAISVPTGAQKTGYLYFTAWDNANNKVNYAPISYKLDNTAPVADLKSPALVTENNIATTSTVDVNGNVTISGTVQDGLESVTANDGKVIKIELWYSIDEDPNAATAKWYQFDSSDTITGLSNSKESFSVTHRFSSSTQMLAVENNILKLADAADTKESQIVWVKVVSTDEINNVGTSIYKLNVNRNSDRPTVSFNTLNLNTDMASNKTVWLKGSTKLQGTVSDDDGIQKTEGGVTSTIQLYITNKANPADGDWNSVTVNNRGAWSYDIKDFFTGTDSEKNIAANKSHTLQFKVVDLEGNTFISNGSPTLGSVYISGKDNNIYGGSERGDSKLYLTVDTLNPEITMNGLYIGTDTNLRTDYADITLGGNVRTFKARVAASDGSNGIANVTGTAQFNELITVTQTADKVSDGVYEVTFTLDLDNAHSVIINNNGNVTIRLVATDNAGNTSVASNVVKFDYKAPEVSVLKPTGTTTSSGSINVYGNVVENSSVTMTYALSTSNTQAPFASDTEAASGSAVTTWSGKNPDTGAAVNNQTLTGSGIKPVYKRLNVSTTWFLYLDGQSGDNHDVQLNDFLINSGVTTRDAIQETKEFTTIVNVYLWIKATDTSGNVSEICSPIYVDPQGERPSLSITYPKPADTTAGGIVTVYGIAEPKNTNVMKYVWVQLDTDYYVNGVNGSTFTSANKTPSVSAFTKDDLDYLTAAGYNVYNLKTYRTDQSPVKWTIGDSRGSADGFNPSDYGVLINTEGSTAWSIKLNSHGEFNNSAANVNVSMKIYAEDNNGNISLKETRSLAIDAGSPVISDIFYRQYSGSNITASKEYSSSTFIKGNWVLTAKASDNERVTSLIIKNSAGTEITTGVTVTGLNTTNATIQYALSTSGVGEDKYTIVVSDGVNTTPKEVVVNYDNTNPELSNFTHYNTDDNGNICQSNGFYKFGGKVIENPVGTANQSGLDFVAFYFQRGTTIFDVMYHQNKSVTTSDYLIGSDGLPWKTYTISSANYNSVTISGSLGDNIHKGGLVRIKGVIYVISNINGSVVTIKGNLDESINYVNSEAAFALASVVDNTVAESSYGDKYNSAADKANYGYGYYKAPANDDGDLIIETVATDGTWTASINSANIKDGPIELHYVAYDKAGNSSSGVVNKRDGTNALWISNNGPRIAGVTFKIDYNGDGKYSKKITKNNKDVYVDDNDENTELSYASDEIVTAFNSAAKSSVSVTNTESGKNYYNPDPEREGLDSLWHALGKKMTIGAANAGAITFKGKTEVYPEIVGGNGKIYYTYKWEKSDSTEKLNGSDSAALIDEGSADYSINTLNKPVTLELGDLIRVGEAKTSTAPDKFVLSFYDSTNGSASLDTSNQKAELEMFVNVNVQATKAPSAKINPFYWNSFADNSIYGSNEDTTYETLQGHIELEADWKHASSYDSTATSGVYDDDPKVSGYIVITGTAHDDIRINKLYFCLPGMETILGTGDGNAGLTPIDVSGAKFFCLASLPSGSSVITGSDYSAQGVKLELTNTYSASGHDINWILSWDTSKITNMANADVAVKVIAENCGSQTQTSSYADKKGIDGSKAYTYTATANSSLKNTPGSTQTTSASKTDCYKMDIVPYITTLKTTLTEYMSTRPSVYGRTALGKYPVYYYSKNSANSDENEYYQVKGFNIPETFSNNNWKVTVKKTDGSNMDITPENNVSVKEKTVSNVIKVTSDTKSGELFVTVNNVVSLNNKNAHTYKDANNKDVKVEYNYRPNGVNNNTLDDNVELLVWNINARAAASSLGSLTEAKMHTSPVDGRLNFSFIHNGGLVFRLPQAINGSITFMDSLEATSTYENSDFVYDKNGHAFGIYAGTNYNGGDVAGHLKLAYSKWGQPDGDAAQGTTYALESMGYKTDWSNDSTSISLPRRFSPVKMAASPYTNSLYLLYYDTLYGELRFKAGTGYGDTKGIFGDFINNGGGNNGANAIGSSIKKTDYSKVSVIANVNTLKNSDGKDIANSSTSSQGVNGKTYGPGQSYSIAVAKKDKSAATHTSANEVAVIVWVDEANKTLWYSYMENPVGNSHYNKSGTETKAMPNNRWSAPQAVLSGIADGVCAIAVDPDNHIHIAAYSTETTGSLVYTYLDNYTSTISSGNVVYVDKYGTTGEYLTLEVAKKSASGRYIPYIGYYSNETPKYAYLDDETSSNGSTVAANWLPKAGVNGNYYTGAWEEVLVPTSSPVVANDKNNNINIALNRDTTAGNVGVLKAITGGPAGDSCVNPVLGYAIYYQGKGYVETAQIK